MCVYQVEFSSVRRVAQIHPLARIGHEHLVGVVLVVVGVGQRAVEAAGGLAEMDAAAGFDQAHVGGGNHRGTIAAALRVKDAEGKASRRERLDGLAEDRAVLGGVAEAVRGLTRNRRRVPGRRPAPWTSL